MLNYSGNNAGEITLERPRTQMTIEDRSHSERPSRSRAANDTGVKPIPAARLILPSEHGAWGFLFEPIVAAVAVAFSVSGLFIALMVIGAFLARQPLKFVVMGMRNHALRERSRLAAPLLAAFAGIILLGLSGTFFLTGSTSLLPFLIVTPLVLFQLYFEFSGKNRLLFSEVAGAIAMSSSSAAIAIAGGFSWAGAFALWLIFIVRLVPSIFYVRTRLKLEKGKPTTPIWAWMSNALAFGIVAAMAYQGSASIISAFVFAVLFARALFGLSRYRRSVKAVKIGIAEVCYGLLTVASVIAGHYVGI